MHTKEQNETTFIVTVYKFTPRRFLFRNCVWGTMQ